MVTFVYVYVGLLEENMTKNNTILGDLGRIWKHINKDDAKKNEHEPNAKSQSEITKNVNSFIPLKDVNDLNLLEEQLKVEDFKNAMVNINFIHFLTLHCSLHMIFKIYSLSIPS